MPEIVYVGLGALGRMVAEDVLCRGVAKIAAVVDPALAGEDFHGITVASDLSEVELGSIDEPQVAANLFPVHLRHRGTALGDRSQLQPVAGRRLGGSVTRIDETHSLASQSKQRKQYTHAYRTRR